MTNPGTLNQRLTLEEPVETPDGSGGVTRSYAAGPQLWASVTPIAARGDVVAADAGARVTHRILVRAGPAITTRHRLRKGARVWRIVSLREDDSSGRFLRLEAQERVE